MKKAILLTALMSLCLTGSQAEEKTAAEEDQPQKIVTFVKEEHEPSWYAKQAALWKAET